MIATRKADCRTHKSSDVWEDVLISWVKLVSDRHSVVRFKATQIDFIPGPWTDVGIRKHRVSASLQFRSTRSFDEPMQQQVLGFKVCAQST